MVARLARHRPFALAGTFVFGLFSAYFALGVLISLGLDRFLDWLFPKNPQPIDFAIGAILGVLLLILGLRNLTSPHLEKKVEQPKSGSLGAILLLSLAVTLATAPAAVPLLAGIDQILRANVSDLQAVLALVFYCAVYVTPLMGLIALRSLLGEASIDVLPRINTVVDQWLPKVMAALFALLGIVLLVDAGGYLFFNRPLW